MLSVQQSQSLIADQCWSLSEIQIKDLRFIEQTPNSPPSGFAVQKMDLFMFTNTMILMLQNDF